MTWKAPITAAIAPLAPRFGTVEPAQVAANVVDAIRRGRDYVFTDDHSADEVAERLGRIVAARDDVVSS